MEVDTRYLWLAGVPAWERKVIELLAAEVQPTISIPVTWNLHVGEPVEILKAEDWRVREQWKQIENQGAIGSEGYLGWLW